LLLPVIALPESRINNIHHIAIVLGEVVERLLAAKDKELVAIKEGNLLE
jgi:hypothetical protein